MGNCSERLRKLNEKYGKDKDKLEKNRIHGLQVILQERLIELLKYVKENNLREVEIATTSEECYRVKNFQFERIIIDHGYGGHKREVRVSSKGSFSSKSIEEARTLEMLLKNIGSLINEKRFDKKSNRYRWFSDFFYKK